MPGVKHDHKPGASNDTPHLTRGSDWLLGPREGFGGPQPTIILGRRDEPEKGKSRLHIDVNATDRDQDAELERLLKLGARPADIGQTGEEQWHVLTDPEGNEFCLLKARLDPL
jgi:Glyoxalase-like domain